MVEMISLKSNISDMVSIQTHTPTYSHNNTNHELTNLQACAHIHTDLYACTHTCIHAHKLVLTYTQIQPNSYRKCLCDQRN